MELSKTTLMASSGASPISQFLKGGPVEGVGLATWQALNPFTNPVERLTSVIQVRPASVWYQARDRLSMPGNYDFFSALNPVEQGTERVLGLEGSDFVHKIKLA